MIRINFDNTYDVDDVSEDLMEFSFLTTLKDDSTCRLFVKIMRHNDPYLLDVFNLGFGPLDKNGEIDDQVKVNHKDISKMFSTLLLCAITFLRNSREGFYIGIDGSNDTRAYLYHRMFIGNLDELKGVISTVGVDWYVRLLRNGTDIERNNLGVPLFKPRPESFDKKRAAIDLYRYYMFSLIN